MSTVLQPDKPGAPSRCPSGGDRITLVGLVFETANGLRHALGPSLENELGVGGQSFEILVRLQRSPGGRLRMSDVAAQTGMTPSGLTRAVDRLVEAGLARRELCPTDRRGAFAALSELGKAKMDAAIARHEATLADLLGGVFTSREEAELVALLHRLRARVNPDAAQGSEPEPVA